MNQTEYDFIQKRRRKRKQRSTFIAWSLIVILAMLVVLAFVLIHNLRKRSELNSQDTVTFDIAKEKHLKEDEISSEMLEYLSHYLDESTRKEFDKEIDQLRANSGYLEYRTLLDAYLSIGSKQDDAIALATYQILAVNEGSVTIEKISDKYEDNINKDMLSPDKDNSTVSRKKIGEIYELECTDNHFLFFNSQVPACGDTISVLEDANNIILITQIQKDTITLEKVWIRDNQTDYIEIEYKDFVFQYPKQTSDYDGYHNMADIVLHEGCISSITPYLDKVNGKLLRVTQDDENGNYCFELDNGEYVSASSNVPVYRLYDQIERVSLSDLIIGYDYTDFVLDESGKVIAALMARYDDMTSIRVVIKNSDYSSAMHEKVELYPDSHMKMMFGEKMVEFEPNEELSFDLSSECFDNCKRIYLVPSVKTGQIHIKSINRSQGEPSYRGQIELQKTASGIVIVNELPLDEYLYSVVPSEMPSSYPKEALKAQAVSARTYAYMHMMHSGLAKYGAHVDDSAGFQVYNNCQETNATTEAVCETKNEILSLYGKPVTTYFYSTSCGLGTDLSAWKYKEDQYSSLENEYLQSKMLSSKYEDEQATKLVSDYAGSEESFEQFIKSMPNDFYESDESYFRWKYQTDFDADLFYEQLQARYEANKQAVLTLAEDVYQAKDINNTGEILDIIVSKRAPGGAIMELSVVTEKATYKVLTEKNARYLLAGSNSSIQLGRGYEKDGSIHGMLPSGFFVISLQKEDERIASYTLYGGGFGHGIGMSQNGAKNMANDGKDYKQILSLSYQNTELDTLQD